MGQGDLFHGKDPFLSAIGEAPKSYTPDIGNVDPHFSVYLQENTTVLVAHSPYAHFLLQILTSKKSVWARWDCANVTLATKKLQELYS